MVERGHEPLKDWWSLPGGVVETGEFLEAALRREVREETGLEVEILCLLEASNASCTIRPALSNITSCSWITCAGRGTLCAADDASRVAWVSEAELGDLKITEGTPAVIRKAFQRIRENG